jgi:gas vesicle protein GvpL/GvpF
MTDDARCVWLYAVAPDGAGLPASDVTGVGGGRARAVRAAGLTAIVEDVRQDEFGEAALRCNLEDLDWLERTARAHHAVVEVMAEHGLVVPMRLATVYSGDDPLADTLGRRAGDLREALLRLGGRREWGVKAYAVTRQTPEDHGPVSGPGGPGAAYLRRRRAQLTSRTNARQDALTGAEAVHAELSRLAVSARLYPPQAPDLAGQAAPMVLNAAYLVADERAGDFTAAVNDLTGRHRSVRLGLTGPWPAYSFAGGPDTSGERQ